MTVQCCSAIDLLSGLLDSSVDCIITDPPYGLDGMGGNWSASDSRTVTASQTVRNLKAGMGCRIGQAKHLGDHLAPVFEQSYRVLKAGGFFICFSSPRLVHGIMFSLEQAGILVRDQAIWLHSSGQFKAGNLRRYGVDSDRRVPMLRPMFESIIIGQKMVTGLVSQWKENGVGLIDSRNLFGTIPSSVFVSEKPKKEERKEGRNHPTQKPSDLVKQLLHIFTKPLDLVVDPFAGSGTTGVAAKALNRRFQGSEIDQKFCSVANTRMTA